MDLQRIKEMEERLNRCTAARADLDRQLGRMEELREDMIRLFAYYGSEDWYEDREAWDAVGEKPEGLTAGVLSEDLVYDGITEVRDLAFRMIESGTDILKNRL